MIRKALLLVFMAMLWLFLAGCGAFRDGQEAGDNRDFSVTCQHDGITVTVEIEGLAQRTLSITNSGPVNYVSTLEMFDRDNMKVGSILFLVPKHLNAGPLCQAKALETSPLMLTIVDGFGGETAGLIKPRPSVYFDNGTLILSDDSVVSHFFISKSVSSVLITIVNEEGLKVEAQSVVRRGG